MEIINQEPKVSVFMFCYNHEEYVQTAIESVLNQTYQNIELIVGNNGSTDRSGEIIAKYEGRIKIVTLEKNNIPECGRRLFAAADGDYLAQISSDDYWYPDKLEKQIRAMKEHPECKICFSWSEMTNDTLEVVINREHFRQENRSRYQWYKDMIVHHTTLEVSSLVMVNSEEIWQCYYDAFRFYQYTDLKQIFNMIMDTEIYIVQEYLVKHRMHGGSVGDTQISGVTARNLAEVCYIISEVWEKVPDDFWVEAYREELISPVPMSGEEVTCEKILMYFKIAMTQNLYYGQGALEYFWRHYYDPGVADILKDKYNFSLENVHEYSKVLGMGAIITEKNTKIQQLENILLENGMGDKVIPLEQWDLIKNIKICCDLIFTIVEDNSKWHELLEAVGIVLEAIQECNASLMRLGIVIPIYKFMDVVTIYNKIFKSDSFDGEVVPVLEFLSEIHQGVKKYIVD